MKYTSVFRFHVRGVGDAGVEGNPRSWDLGRPISAASVCGHKLCMSWWRGHRGTRQGQECIPFSTSWTKTRVTNLGMSLAAMHREGSAPQGCAGASPNRSDESRSNSQHYPQNTKIGSCWLVKFLKQWAFYFYSTLQNYLAGHQAIRSRETVFARHNLITFIFFSSIASEPGSQQREHEFLSSAPCLGFATLSAAIAHKPGGTQRHQSRRKNVLWTPFPATGLGTAQPFGVHCSKLEPWSENMRMKRDIGKEKAGLEREDAKKWEQIRVYILKLKLFYKIIPWPQRERQQDGKDSKWNIRAKPDTYLIITNCTSSFFSD